MLNVHKTASEVFETVKMYVARAIDVVEIRLSAHEKRLASLEEAPQAPEPEAVDYERIERFVAESIPPIPEPEEVDYERIERFVAERLPPSPEPFDPSELLRELQDLRKQVQELSDRPPPVASEPEAVDYERVERFVAERVGAIELPAVRDGVDGRDATQIDIIDINPEKTYPRGTYGTLRGGLVRAFRATDPVDGPDLDKHGWQIIVDGVASVDIESVEERGFALRVQRSSGVTESKEFSLPIPIYREVFRDGQSYQKNDVVTYSGSAWIAKQDTTEKPGMGGSDWVLMVKQGRDRPRVRTDG